MGMGRRKGVSQRPLLFFLHFTERKSGSFLLPTLIFGLDPYPVNPLKKKGTLLRPQLCVAHAGSTFRAALGRQRTREPTPRMGTNAWAGETEEASQWDAGVPQAWEKGKGTGPGRGVHCSPVKAPNAFLMSSALSKSVIDILQLFERAEQVRKD